MRVLIVSDIHANLAALEAVIEDAAGRYDGVWCLGDTVGYGPEPDACVARVRAMAALTVIGNHDWAALGRMDVEDFNPEARRAVVWTRDHLSAESLAWLSELPSEPTQHERYTLTHASPRDPVWEYVLYPGVATENFGHFTTAFCLVGHTHVPALHILVDGETKARPMQPTFGQPMQLKPGWRGILNPGSVGQPRDNDRRAAYALLDTEAAIWEPRRVDYNVEVTQKRMRDAGLPERLINRLAFGW
ncbi:MAG: metallophosphatase family protein [Anaerolineae bacterium]|jgi:predicted phosphodiesterase|nr:metallophosphatase family protein [Anaerolineae bacterium]